ncbi:DNA directed DNA polymerase [Caudoviricetes sp.]|nr:DNA directed DNA polymerase [Caudoviricetes sp.]
MADLDKYLKFLYESSTGYVYSPVKKKDGSWETYWFQWPSQEQALKDHISVAKMDGNVYVAPALFSSKSAKKEAFKHSNVVWVEFDGQKEMALNGIPAPDMIVQTSSETHTHCFWKIEETNAESIEDVNRRLTYFMEADGSGWDCTQVLRPPDTINWKHDLPVKLIKHNVPVFKHSLRIFDAAPTLAEKPQVITYDDLENVEKILPKYNLGETLTRDVLTTVVLKGQMSTFLMAVGYRLAEKGLTPQEVVSCLYNVDVRLKKFVGREDQLQRLSQIASIAFLKVTHTAVESYSPMDIINHEHDLTWVLEGWLHDRGILMLTGAPGVGKTQLALQMVYCLTTGQPFLGRQIYIPKDVGFLSLEMTVLELKYIFTKQSTAWKEEEHFSLWNDRLKVFAPDEAMDLADMEKLIEKNKPSIVLIDSLTEMGQDDVVKESEARRLMSWVRRVRTKYGCAIILIHHNRKASTGNAKPKKLSDLYGSFIFAKLTETVISLWDTERDGILELDTLKARFGSKDTIKLRRDNNLVFEKVTDKNANRNPGSGGAANPLLEFLT